MLEWSVDAFRAAGVAAIVVACPPGRSEDGTGGSLQADDLQLVDGGATRSQSVASALAAVETELVAIHDAARPLLTPELIEGVLATLAADPDAAGAIAAAPVSDTIKRTLGRVASEGGHGDTNTPLDVKGTLDRTELWAAQTPQVFRVAALRSALDVADENLSAATDEAMLVEAAGGRVLIHPAPAENIKVTTALDLRLAELLVAERSAQ